jgi:hypothetical protein
MTVLEVFDPPMCCSSGVCGPSVDPRLPRIAADLEWLKSSGVQVERYNLAHQPREFVSREDVKEALQVNGDRALPMIRVNGHIVSKGLYPSRELLAAWCRLSANLPSPINEPTTIGAAQ